MVHSFMRAERSCPSQANVAWVNVTFYGVRGSCPCSGDRYRRYGGNTSCLVIDIEGDEPLIVDLGTGLRALGDVLHKEVRASALRCTQRRCSPTSISTTFWGSPSSARCTIRVPA